jgi:hypothetical protein
MEMQVAKASKHYLELYKQNREITLSDLKSNCKVGMILKQSIAEVISSR